MDVQASPKTQTRRFYHTVLEKQEDKSNWSLFIGLYTFLLHVFQYME
jgi:hypothetical protein